MSINYSQYLGSKRCCNINSQGPQGIQGPTGPASIGPIGPQGFTGLTGPTGRSCLGPTGPVGPQGVIGPQGVTGPVGPSVLPLSSTNNNSLNTVVYDSLNNNLLYNTTKTFVIEHPVIPNKFLVHACLEGPETGVYYRGKGEITNDNFATIVLPDYLYTLASEFTVQITPIFNGKLQNYNVSEVIDNQFNVYGNNGKFFWIVHGKRYDIEVEPNKTDVNVNGNGPYLWIE